MKRRPHVLTRRIQQIFAGFVVVMILLVSVALVPALTSRDRVGTLRDRWLPARAATLRLSTSLVDQESGERGYVITGDPKFLDSYRSGTATSATIFSRLSRVLKSDPHGRSRLRTVRSHYTEWKSRAAGPEIAAAHGPDRDIARAIIAEGTGKRLFDRLRASLRDLTSYADGRVADAQQAITDANDALVITLVATLAAVAGLAAIARQWLRQWSARLDQQLEVEAQLASQTALLESITTETPDPIFLKDSEGRYVFMNPAAARAMGGEDPDDFVGRHDHDILSPQDAAPIAEDDDQVRRLGVAHMFEEQVGDRLFLTTKNPYDFPDGTRGVLGVAREITERKRNERQLASIGAVTRATASEITVAEVALAARDPLRTATGADLIWIFLADPSGRHLDTILDDGTLAATGREWGSMRVDSPTMTATAFRTGATHILESPESLQDPAARAAFEREHLHTSMQIPFPAEARIAGVVALGWRHDHTAEAHREQSFFASLIAALAESLARAQSYELQHAAVAAFQRALLPDDIFPPDIEIAVRYEPAVDELDVGGDWYDVFELQNNRLGIVVGDVVGNGVGAAAVMGQLKSALKAIATIVEDPAEVIARLDQYAEHEPGAVATTLCYGVLDRDRRVLEYCCAGHPAPLVVHADGTGGFLEDGRSFPIGASWHGSSQPRENGQVTLAENSVLVLYTDGLIERRGRSLDAGFEQLRSTVVSSRGLPIEELADTMLDRLDPAHRRDDTAFMCVRIPSDPSRHLTCRIPADVRRLGALRAEIRVWLRAQGLDDPTVEDVVLATFEAVANAIEHGYQGSDREHVIVELSLRDELHVTVRDRGRWTAQIRRPERGRGQEIMRAVMDDVEIERERHGTVVRMRRRVSRTTQIG